MSVRWQPDQHLEPADATIGSLLAVSVRHRGQHVLVSLPRFGASAID